MKIIGITGKSGSGKSTLAKKLSEKLNYIFFDTDELCHQALYQEEIIEKLRSSLGNEIFSKNQIIDRKKLGNIVFQDNNKMKLLTDLTWTYMENVIDNEILKNDKNIIIEGILLPKTKYWNNLDYRICVKADYSTRKQRVIDRDNISEEYFKKRESSNIEYNSIKFDYIYKSDETNETLEEVTNKLCKVIIKIKN